MSTIVILFLFVCIWCLMFYLLTRMRFVKNSGLNRTEIFSLFTLRIAVGCLLGWISIRYYPSNDYWNLVKESRYETELLKSNPLKFFTSLFESPYENPYGQFFNAVGSYWNDLRNNLIQKSLAVMNLITAGNYYLNSIFFNAFGFLGHLAFFRLFDSISPGNRKKIMWAVFLLPSTLYFSSGIHKDLLVFSLMGFFLLSLYLGTTQHWKLKYVITAIISLMGLVLMRNYLLLIFIPTILGYWMAIKFPRLGWRSFLLVIVLGILSVSIVQWIKPEWSPLVLIEQRQHDFLSLKKANSQMELTPLKPDVVSFLKQMPEAVGHGFFRPIPTESKHIFTLALSLELIFFWVLLMIVLINRARRSSLFNHSFVMMLFLLTAALWILMGYITPNYLTLARYRSLYYVLVIPPLLMQWNAIDWLPWRRKGQCANENERS